MNFFKTIFTEKLAAMRAAAPRATLRMLHESNGFSLYLDEAAAARKASQLGTLTDHAEDILEDSVPILFIPLEQTLKFVEEVTAHHSVAFVDVCLANRVNNARHTMYAYFPKRFNQEIPEWVLPMPANVGDQVFVRRKTDSLMSAEERLRIRLAEHDGCSRWGVKDAAASRPAPSAGEEFTAGKENADDDFWG